MWKFPYFLATRCLGISFRWLSELLSHRGFKKLHLISLLRLKILLQLTKGHKAILASVWIYSAAVVTVPWAGKYGIYESQTFDISKIYLKQEYLCKIFLAFTSQGVLDMT